MTAIKNYNQQFSEIQSLIITTKQRIYHSVNTALIDLYWQIGAYVHNKIKSSEWGKSVVQKLSDYILKNEPDSKGFSAQNIWRMKQFYATYSDNVILSPLVRELSWTNNLLVLSKSNNNQEREFYLRLAIQEKYSSRELERQIDSGLFERSITNNQFLSAVLRELHPAAERNLRDIYLLDFLSLPKHHSEKDFRKAIVKNLKEFVIEFGKDFALVGEEYRLQVGNKDFYVDLLFYHRELQCLVVFDLKITDFKPEYMGKMEFYLEALDNDVKKEHEKPSVGIILCKNHDTQVVQYALNRSVSPTMVAKYETQLIDKKLLEQKLDEFFTLEEPRVEYQLTRK
ncbi:PDDEXK nuclease domain-containing protein [Alkaliflexus imshenetskii]|uniref:PDDEXK nuclease domain-containing protein n=1 Tax=Alkaliflexus imshenetskii TaxID=286730 RepID=UPI00047BCF48|nr:PDDEXK nuclease domain-containing protein [Alkaliflexus imshenetskii]